MLSPEAFELSMEAQLKMRVITDEVENCTNIEELKEQLIASAKLILRYQNLLAKVLQENLKGLMDENKIALHLKEANNDN